MLRRILLATTVSGLVAATTLATNGTRMIGFNAKTVGRGGTSVGIFDSPSLMMTNPAGIGFLKGAILDGNFSLMVPGLNFKNGINEAEGKTNYYPLPDLAYVNSTSEKLNWGIGAFTQGGMGSEFMLNHQLFRDQTGAFIQQEYFSKLALMEGGPSVAYKITPEFSIGASAHLAYSMLEFKMPYSLSPSVMKGVINPVTGMTFGDMFAAPPAMGGFGYPEVTAAAAMSNLTAFGFAGKIGIAWVANESVSFGLTYTTASPLTYKKGKAKMDMTAQLNDAFGKAMQGYMMQNPGTTQAQAQTAVMAQFAAMDIDLSKGAVADYDLQLKLKFPQSLAFGTSVRMTEAFRVSMDLEWVNWKNAFDKMTLALSNGNNPNINRMLGNSGSFSLDFPMSWEDAYCVRLGAELDVTRSLVLRAGGSFGTNPVPDQTVFPVFPAIVENHVMIGTSYKVSPTFQVHVAYEHALNNEQTAANPSVLAQEYNKSISELRENIFHLSFTWVLE